MIKAVNFPNVKRMSVDYIWRHSDGFNLYRGFEWMKDPCRSCPEKEKDMGGCRCQALMPTGDAANADPVCGKSAQHHLIEQAVAQAQVPDAQRVNVKPLVFRDPKNSQPKTVLHNFSLNDRQAKAVCQKGSLNCRTGTSSSLSSMTGLWKSKATR